MPGSGFRVLAAMCDLAIVLRTPRCYEVCRATPAGLLLRKLN